MSGDWIKMRAGLRRDINVFRLARKLSVSQDEMLATLHELAAWFLAHGKYGKLKASPGLIDSYTGMTGLAAGLTDVDWLREHNGVLCLRGFCQVSAARKSLGVKIRQQVLDGAACNACGSTQDLVIDHITPVVYGGSCDISNLQPLCRTCNARKGRKSMAEFMAEASA